MFVEIGNKYLKIDIFSLISSKKGNMYPNYIVKIDLSLYNKNGTSAWAIGALCIVPLQIYLILPL